jgi:ABC-type phosphate/phosphonate transport system substrate-binding protein
MSWARWISSTLAVTIAVGAASLAGARASNPTPVRVGMVQTFFSDVPQVMVDMATDPFAAVMREATGLAGQLVVGGDAFDVARQLEAGNIHLAVFHSFEFAWVRQQHPGLKPLMIAVNQRQVQAILLTRKDSSAVTFADFKGKDVALPRRSKEHCRQFLKQRSYEAGQCPPQELFKQVVASVNVETALDDLCAGKHEAVVVDRHGLEFYRDLKPGCFARFKVIEESEPFPPALIAYRDGSVAEATLRRVESGLGNASQLDLGRAMMKMWKIHAFAPVPAGYEAGLTSILRAYPMPEPAALVSRR